MPAYAEEAADLQHGETQLLLVLVRDHIIDSPDLLVLVVDDAAANQLAHPIAFRDDRKIHLDELHRGLRQRGVLALELMPGALASSLMTQYLEIKERSLI